MSILIYFATIFWSLFPNLIHVFQGGEDFVNKVNTTNLFSNGDFSDGITGWSAIHSVNSYSNGVLTNTGNGVSLSPFTEFNLDMDLSNQVLLAVVRFRTLDSALSVGTNFYTGVDNEKTLIDNPVNDTWYVKSVIAQNGSGIVQIQNIRHYYSTNVLANGSRLEVDYIQLYNITDMKLNGVKNDNGIPFSDLTNEQIKTQLDTWINDYGDLDFIITKDNTADSWFNTGFVDKQAERDFLDYLGYFVWLMTPPIMLFITLDLIRRLL